MNLNFMGCNAKLVSHRHPQHRPGFHLQQSFGALISRDFSVAGADTMGKSWKEEGNNKLSVVSAEMRQLTMLADDGFQI